MPDQTMVQAYVGSGNRPVGDVAGAGGVVPDTAAGAGGRGAIAAHKGGRGAGAGEPAGMRHHRLLRVLYALRPHEPAGRQGANGLRAVG